MSIPSPNGDADGSRERLLPTPDPRLGELLDESVEKLLVADSNDEDGMTSEDQDGCCRSISRDSVALLLSCSRPRNLCSLDREEDCCCC